MLLSSCRHLHSFAVNGVLSNHRRYSRFVMDREFARELLTSIKESGSAIESSFTRLLAGPNLFPRIQDCVY